MFGFLTKLFGVRTEAPENHQIGYMHDERGYRIIIVQINPTPTTLRSLWTAHAKRMNEIEVDDDYSLRGRDLVIGMWETPRQALIAI